MTTSRLMRKRQTSVHYYRASYSVADSKESTLRNSFEIPWELATIPLEITARSTFKTKVYTQSYDAR